MKSGGKELTRQSRWKYRVIAGSKPSPWSDSAEKAIRPFAPVRHRIAMPANWSAFALPCFDPRLDTPHAEVPDIKTLKRIPSELVIAKHRMKHATLHQASNGLIDITTRLGPAFPNRTAWLFGAIVMPRAGAVIFRAGADWRMQWFIDGVQVYETLSTGNRTPILNDAHEFRADLTKGRHVLAVRVLSGGDGWALACEAVLLPKEAENLPAFALQAQRTFSVADPEAFTSLSFSGNHERLPKLNEAEIPVPLPAIVFHDIPALPHTLLKKGLNTLSINWTPEESKAGADVQAMTIFRKSAGKARLVAEGTLFGQTWKDAVIHTGPILNWLGKDFFTVSCRTNMRVPITLNVDNRSFTDKPTLFHRFHVSSLKPGTRYSYTIVPTPPDMRPLSTAARTGTVTILPKDNAMTFAVTCNAHASNDTWNLVSNALHRRKPAFIVMPGDLVKNAMSDSDWENYFFSVKPDLFTHIPLYAVTGDHEHNSPVFEKIFISPGEFNWAQKIGNVTLIGLDGNLRWLPGSEEYAWLVNELAQTNGSFKFVFTHFSPFASAIRGNIDGDGHYSERAIRVARERILPLLTRHNVTAVFAGHDYGYERSEPPGGPAVILCAGANLPPLQKDAKRQNAFSKVLVNTHPYCMLSLKNNECSMQAFDHKGHVIDTRTWTTLSS